jgi:two-component system, LytTR family, response regulator
MIAVNQYPLSQVFSPKEGIFFCEAKQEFYSHEIVLLVASVNYTYVYLQSGKVLTVSKTLKKFEKPLTNIGFLRIHKSAIINPAFMDNHSPKEVTMQNGKVIKVSRRKQGLVGY